MSNNKKWRQQKYNLARNFFYELQYMSLQLIPNDKIQQYMKDLQNHAASKIQATWRGFVCRKQLQKKHSMIIKERSAKIIQRNIKEWLFKKKQPKSSSKHNAYISRISEERLEKFKNEIEEWPKNNHIKLDNRDQLYSQHKEVSDKLNNFYYKALESKQREQRADDLYKQIDDIFSLLQNIPPLNSSKKIDWIVFQSPLVSNVAKAKLAHKRRLKNHGTPWWKKYQYEIEEAP